MEKAENKILNSYWGLLSNLNTKLKLDLIEKLTQSIKSDHSKKSKIKSAFGAWKSDETAEELIEKIRSSRYTNRQIEKL